MRCQRMIGQGVAVAGRQHVMGAAGGREAPLPPALAVGVAPQQYEG